MTTTVLEPSVREAPAQTEREWPPQGKWTNEDYRRLPKDRREKFATYARAGLREYWIVNPPARTIELFHCAMGLTPNWKVRCWGNGALGSLERL